MTTRSWKSSGNEGHYTLFKEPKKARVNHHFVDYDKDKSRELVKDRHLALRGGFNLTANPLGNWRAPRSKLRIYVSSAFTDTELERNVLENEILPKLRQRADPFDIEVSFVDLNYGLRDELTLDTRAWVESLRELKRCYSESSGVFFLSMLSEKYGRTPLPQYIIASVFDNWIASDSRYKRDADWYRSWYILDKNALPHRYELRNPATISDNDTWANWRAANPVLTRTFDGLPFDETFCDDILVGRSIQDWELKSALRLMAGVGADNTAGGGGSGGGGDIGMSRMLWLQRVFEGGVSEEEDRYWDYDDTLDDEDRAIYMQRLSSWMFEHVPSDRLIKHTNVTLESYLEEDEKWQQQKRGWMKDISNRLIMESLAKVIRHQKSWERDGCGMGLSGERVAEMLHHCELAAMKVQEFVGREAIVDQLMDVILAADDPQISLDTQFNEDSSSSSGSCVDDVVTAAATHHVQQPTHLQGIIRLAVVGHSGVGKSSLMAKLAATVYARQHHQEQQQQQQQEADDNKTNVLGSSLGVASRQLQRIIDSLLGVVSVAKPPAAVEEEEGEEVLSSAAAGGGGRIRRTTQRPVVVIRFCGTSTGSRTVLELVRSICAQIHLSQASLTPTPTMEDHCLSEDDLDHIHHMSYDEAVAHFHELLQNSPVVLFLDGINLLSSRKKTNNNKNKNKVNNKKKEKKEEEDKEKKKEENNNNENNNSNENNNERDDDDGILGFLRGVKPHKGTRIIVSSTLDEWSEDGTWKNVYGCNAALESSGVPRFTVEPLHVILAHGSSSWTAQSTTDEAYVVLKGLLSRRNRSLTDKQFAFAIHQIAYEPTAMYVKLASRVVETWTSSLGEQKGLELSPGVHSLLHQMMQAYEVQFGRVLVRAALGFLTLSKSGVTDTEMADLLSLHDEVLSSISKVAPLTVECVPLHFWLRIRSEVGDLLLEQDDKTVIWQHRQLKAVAAMRYGLQEQRELHRVMAMYYSDLVKGDDGDDDDEEEDDIKAGTAATTTAGSGSSGAFESPLRPSSSFLPPVPPQGPPPPWYSQPHQEPLFSNTTTATAAVTRGPAATTTNNNNNHSTSTTAATNNYHSSSTAAITKKKKDPPHSQAQRRLRIRWKSESNHHNKTVGGDYDTHSSSPSMGVDSTCEGSMISYGGTHSQSIVDSIATIDTFYSSTTADHFSYHHRRRQQHHPADHTRSNCSTPYASPVKQGGLLFTPTRQSLAAMSSPSVIRQASMSLSLSLAAASRNIASPRPLAFSSSSPMPLPPSSSGRGRSNAAAAATTGTVITSTASAMKVDTFSGSVFNKCDLLTAPDVHSDDAFAFSTSRKDITAVCFSPDYSKIVSGSWDSVVVMWDASSCYVLWTYRMTTVPTNDDDDDYDDGYGSSNCSIDNIVFTPDGRNVIIVPNDSHYFQVLGVATGAVIRTVRNGPKHSKLLTCCFDGDVTRIATAFDNKTVLVSAIEDGEVLTRFAVKKRVAHSMWFSPDATQLYTQGGDLIINVWDTATGALLSKLSQCIGAIKSIKLHPISGRMLAVTNPCLATEHCIQVWDVQSRKIVFRIDGSNVGGANSSSNHTDEYIHCVSDDCVRLCSVSTRDAVITMWDIDKGMQLARLKGSSGVIKSMCFGGSDGSRIATSYDDGTTRMWSRRDFFEK